MSLVFVDDVVGLPPPPPPARPRVLLIATVLGSAAAVMAFGGMLAVYITERQAIEAAGGAWLPEDAELALTPGNMALATLVLLLVMVQWAVHSISLDDRRNAYIALGLTVVLGAAYINEIAFYYTQVGMGVDEPVGVLFYAITAAHIAMTGVGMAFSGLVAFRTLGGQYSGRDREGIVANAIYWYVTVAVYVAIWYAIFITK